MAKNCAICGTSINVFQSQKLADGNFLCRKVCCKKALTKYFDFVNATLPEYKDNVATVERGTKIWERLFVPRLKSKDKNEKLERRYQPMIVAPSLGLVALLETRYKFMNFGKSEHACVFRLDDLVCYETEKDGRSDDPDVYNSSIYVDDSSENYDNDVIIAYGLLSEADEVRYYMEMGMSLQYTWSNPDHRRTFMLDLCPWNGTR